MKNKVVVMGMLIVALGQVWAGPDPETGLPVNPPRGRASAKGIRNPLTFEQIRNIVGVADNGEGLLLDLKDESLFGTIYSGPYPFESAESDFDSMRFRLKSSLVKGRGVILCSAFMHQDKINANDWPQPHMTVAYRLELYKGIQGGHSKRLGFYDSVVSFAEVPRANQRSKSSPPIRKTLTVIEGPLMNELTSDDPTEVRITWQTDQPATGRVCIMPTGLTSEKRMITSEPCKRVGRADASVYQFETVVQALKPDTPYQYTVVCEAGPNGRAEMGPYRFRTAPKPGQGRVVFAFASDSREGVGGGERATMGHNAKVLQHIAQDAYRRGAQFFIFGGDLVNGYTTATDDFRLQMRGWKQSMAGFWRTRSVFPVMGNHEALLKVINGISFDKWPYATHSAEAIFAENFWNPQNGPEPSDKRRPTYKENVYSFQYGPVLCIGYNNNYWWTSNDQCARVGGCPEGYLLDDQLDWIEAELARAQKDPTIRSILLYAQEPVFPCGGHVGDCMWWRGDNRLRAHTYSNGKILSEPAGMIEVRNRFWRALAQSTKVAAVLSGDEHEYHRLLVDDATPVGVMSVDDLNGNNRLDDGKISANAEFTHPVWHITAGTAGAPYYAQEETPWTPVFFSSQAGYCLFEAEGDRLSLTFYTHTGQKLDHVPNLMAVK